MLWHIKQRRVCTSATHSRVSATPKPLELLASNNLHVGNERNFYDIHAIKEHASLELNDDTRSINSQNGTAYLSSLHPKNPMRDFDESFTNKLDLSHNGLKETAEKLDTARTQAEFDRPKARTRVGDPSVLSLLHENNFKFVTGFVFESMSTIENSNSVSGFTLDRVGSFGEAKNEIT